MPIWIFTAKRKRQAILEGWYFFGSATSRGPQVQRIDDQDDPEGQQLENDDDAIRLALEMGVPIDEQGYILKTWEVRGL